MNAETARQIHWSFWLIGVVALIWNVLGAINYVVQTNPDAMASYPETARAIIEDRPAWATGGFAVAVFGGALGCLLLLFRKSITIYVLIGALLGVIVTMIHTLGVAFSTAAFNPFEIIMMILSPIVVAIFLVWYSIYASSQGWLA